MELHLKTVTEMLEKRFRNLKKISGGSTPPDPPPHASNLLPCPWGKKDWKMWGGG